MNKRINLRISNILLLAIFLPFVFYQCKEKTEQVDIPRVVHVTKNEVIIGWESKDKYKGILRYRLAGNTKRSTTVEDKLGKTSQHEIIINGLSPSTLYSYWLKKSETLKYTFQTEPENSLPFSFMIACGDSTQNYSSLLASENCGFILSVKGKQENSYKAENSYVPIFYLDGNNPDMDVNSSTQDSWKMDWGGLRLVMYNKGSNDTSLFNSQGSHTIGIIFNTGIVKENAEEIKKSGYHQSFKIHNENNPNTLIAFVGIVDYSFESFNLDGINYFSIPVNTTISDENKNPNAIVINVDVESATAYFSATNKEMILKVPPLQSKRTCTGCRRLAEKGSYDESLKAYQGFIDNNKGNYQIDDAYFAIAEIYDEKLFKFAEANERYKKVIELFPDGTLAPIAKQRISYIAEYSDFNYEPLEKFERIKKSDYANAKGDTAKQRQLLTEVEKIVREYPESKIVPVIIFWLANQYQTIDYKKAIEYYAGIQKNYLEFSKANEISYKIGETYYIAKLYKEAKETFLQAKNEFPQLSETIDSQLERVNRNIRRVNLVYFSWFLSIFILLLTIFLKPIGLNIPRRKPLLIITLIYALLVSLFGWEIREEFNSDIQMVLFILSFIVLIPLSLIVAKTWTTKLFSHKVFLSKMVSGIVGILFFMSACILAIYYIYEHYLIVINF